MPLQVNVFNGLAQPVAESMLGTECTRQLQLLDSCRDGQQDMVKHYASAAHKNYRTIHSDARYLCDGTVAPCSMLVHSAYHRLRSVSGRSTTHTFTCKLQESYPS